MSTRIIPLVTIVPKRNKTDLSMLCNAAWNFAHTILWPEQQFCKSDLDQTLYYIKTYFEQSGDKAKAFIVFCERIILTNRYLSGDAKRFVPNPAEWFNKSYAFGFAGTKSWYQQIQTKRETIPGYLQHISIMAKSYYAFISKPSTKIFNRCRKKLIELKANSLLQHFYNCITHFTYTTL